MDKGSRTYGPSDTEYADVLDVLCQVEQWTVDELGLLELSDGEECLHAIQCSISKPKSKDSEDGELGQILVGTKHIYVRVVTGLESKVQYRVPYQQVTRWDIRHHPPTGSVANIRVASPGTIHIFVKKSERKRYQGHDAWYAVVEQLVKLMRSHQPNGMEEEQQDEEERAMQVQQGIESIVDEFYRNSRISSMPLGQSGKERMECFQVYPFCSLRGSLEIGADTVVFRPYCSDRLGRVRIKKSEILLVRKRPYIVDCNACEIYFGRRASVFFVFEHEEDATRLVQRLKEFARYTMIQDVGHIQRLWLEDSVSNFQYLMYLNDLAGRSYKNIHRYPVFPWVLSDYTSDSLNLRSPNVYRNLSKPIAALTEKKAMQGLEMYQALKESNVEDPWMFGSHYSNPGIVVFFTVRQNPKLMLKLQGGSFDHPNRMFRSIPAAWASVSSASGSDVKELIPQLYDPQAGLQILRNNQYISLGGDFGHLKKVVLPPWATSIEEFLEKMRLALESDHVSSHIHAWIDLVFGIHARGEGAIKHHNVFHYMTYDEIATEIWTRPKRTLHSTERS
eukprot:jgi/Picre1/31793/NNA_007143.t1